MLGRESIAIEENQTSDEQILVSFQRIGKIQAKSIELVSEKRITADQREIEARSGADHQDRKRTDELLQESNSRYDDEAVAPGWDQCLAATNLQDLSELMAKQKNLCESALAKLDQIGWIGYARER